MSVFPARSLVSGLAPASRLRIHVIDNRDSFTWNIVAALQECGAQVTVADHQCPLPSGGVDAFVISPGPGHPGVAADVGVSREALESGLPVLGVCLGHQLMAHVCGGRVEQVSAAHGQVVDIVHDSSPLFDALPSPFPAVRYNSLGVTELPAELVATAWDSSGAIMALEHRQRPWWGVQFHPESAGAVQARAVLANFVRLIERPRVWHRFVGRLDLRPQDLVGQDNCFWLDDARETGWSFVGCGRPGPPRMMRADTSACPCPAVLGWVGWLTYEGQAEGLWVDSCVAFGPDGVHLLSLSEEGLELLRPEEEASISEPKQLHLRCRDTREQYVRKVREIQQLIAQGQTYEACLTTQLSGPDPGVGLAEYLALRAAHPSQFGAFMRIGGTTLMSTSPETFLSVRDGRVVSRPIKGTRPRGATPADDAALAADLATHPKDAAENLMIVDLVRNDLGHVCVPGSVRVEELCQVETFPSVHQLVSTVTGQLEGTDPWAAVRAAFPGGSMTGAPKVRTMELLAGIEGQPRGVYSGAFGWVGVGGEAELAMTIRTLIARDGTVSWGVGGAVLAASDPQEEYAEIITKATALQAIATVEFD